MQAIFRTPRTGLIISTLLSSLALYAVVRAVAPEGSVIADYPFGVAMLIALGLLAARSRGERAREAIVADEEGLEDRRRGVRLPWSKVQEVRIEDEPAGSQSAGGIRVASVCDGLECVRFSDESALVQDSDIVPVSNAGLLLGVIAEQSHSAALYPATWTAPKDSVRALDPDPSPPGAKVGLGLAALLFKAGPKALTMGLKLLKTIKPGAAVVAIGAYSLMFSWKFAFALVLHVLVHECGHVFAMFRSGVSVRGIYLIPFFGGAAVSKGIAQTRWNSAYIALNGPVWGLLLSAAFAAAHIGLAGAHPILGALAAWGALINLFNLLPILPLDGGRVLTSLAASSEQGLGLPITVATLVFGAGVAYFAQLELLVLMVFVGLIELGVTLAARPIRPALTLVGTRPLGTEEFAHFARLMLPRSAKGREKLVQQRAATFEAGRQQALQVPMSRRQAALILAGYLVVAGLLVATLVAMTSVQGAGDPMSLLR